MLVSEKGAVKALNEPHGRTHGAAHTDRTWGGGCRPCGTQIRAPGIWPVL